MYVVDIQKAEADFVASLLFCVYAYTRMRRARRRCICAAPAALESGEEGESVVIEEVDAEIKVQSEPQGAAERETLTPSPPSQPSLASPTLSHSSLSHSSSSTSLQVNYDVEDFPIPHVVSGGQAHGQGEGTLSRLDTSDHLTASSLNHVVGIGGAVGGDGVLSRQVVTQRSSSHGPLRERHESEDSTPPPLLSSAREIVSPDSTSVGSEARQQSARLLVSLPTSAALIHFLLASLRHKFYPSIPPSPILSLYHSLPPSVPPSSSLPFFLIFSPLSTGQWRWAWQVVDGMVVE